MTGPNTADRTPQGIGSLPIQPTGSGVADLAVAYEQMRLSEDDGIEVSASDVPVTPTEDGADAAESAAHPS